MKISPSILSDEHKFRAFWIAAILYQKSKRLPLWPAYPEEKIRDEIVAGLHFSAFMPDGTLAGYFSLALSDALIWEQREKGDAVYIHRMCVNPGCKGNNLAAAVLIWANDYGTRVHGVVQLEGGEWKRRGYNFPESVEGIRVGAAGRRIHLLHANSAFDDPKGTVVASLILHYSDGDQARFDIRQGIEVLDWWEWPRAPVKRPTNTNTVVAWTGSNPPSEHQGARIRLFDTAFVNPHPEKEIQTIDYTSAMANSAPFMVGLTIEH